MTRLFEKCIRKANRPSCRNEARCLAYLLLLLPSLLLADYHYPVGERATYTIKWGLLSCGTSTITCEEVELGGENLIRIRVHAKSNWLISTIYPVDDTVDCFIDPKTQLSVRLEKSTSEGGFICKDILVFDREKNTAQWDSQSLNISTNYPITADACDAISFLYTFRQFEFTEGQSRNFKMAVDTALHEVSITAGNTKSKKIGASGKVLCRKFTATPKRDDLFVRKVPEEIWISEDDRKIMAKMVVKVPVGSVRIVLDEYVPPKP
jgi:hypothetical protein